MDSGWGAEEEASGDCGMPAVGGMEPPLRDGLAGVPGSGEEVATGFGVMAGDGEGAAETSEAGVASFKRGAVPG